MKKLDTDRVVGLSAVGIGLSSLFVVVYQTYRERVSQRAAVMPYLTVAMHANDRYVGLALSNVGLAPALVGEVRVHYRGRDSGRPVRLLPSGTPGSVGCRDQENVANLAAALEMRATAVESCQLMWTIRRRRRSDPR